MELQKVILPNNEQIAYRERDRRRKDGHSCPWKYDIVKTLGPAHGNA